MDPPGGQVERFPLAYGAWSPLLAVLGLGPNHSGLELSADRLSVRMGWGFRCEIPRSAIASAAPLDRRVASIGVHGWRGSWLVNGAMSGIVAIELGTPQRCRVTGVPAKLRRLLVGVEEPAALCAALGASASA